MGGGAGGLSQHDLHPLNVGFHFRGNREGAGVGIGSGIGAHAHQFVGKSHDGVF